MHMFLQVCVWISIKNLIETGFRFFRFMQSEMRIRNRFLETIKNVYGNTVSLAKPFEVKNDGDWAKLV